MVSQEDKSHDEEYEEELAGEYITSQQGEFFSINHKEMRDMISILRESSQIAEKDGYAYYLSDDNEVVSRFKVQDMGGVKQFR